MAKMSLNTFSQYGGMLRNNKSTHFTGITTNIDACLQTATR